MRTGNFSRTYLLACVTLGLAFAAAFPGVAFGQATRTWVSGLGDDANPCSRTAPCKTFAGAISKTAVGGEIDVTDDGGFGAVTITKSLTINGSGHLAGVLVSGGNGIVVNAAATDTVVLRGLDIQGLGTGSNGVNDLGAKVVRVENSLIEHFTNGVNLSPSNSGAQMVIQNTTITSNSANGVIIAPSASVTNLRVTLRNDFIDENNCGAVAASFGAGGSTCGVGISGTANRAAFNIFNTALADNTADGILAAGTQAVARISGNQISGNGVGLDVGAGGTITSFGNNSIGGNTVDTNGGAPNGGTIALKASDLVAGVSPFARKSHKKTQHHTRKPHKKTTHRHR